MDLEEQLGTLAQLGLSLNAGITVDDLLYSFPRTSYEEAPFDLVLFKLGGEVEREPWGRQICDRVWNFDTECITQTGDYVRIVRGLCRVAACPDLLSDLRDSVDLETGDAWLEYRCDGKQRHWPIEVNDDWADCLTLSYVMADLERDGHRFYSKDNGQAMLLFYLDTKAAARLDELAPGCIEPMLPA